MSWRWKIVSLHIRDGEFMILLGPVRLRQIDDAAHDRRAGEHYRRAISTSTDKRINDVDPRDRDLAIVFQNYALYPHMTVRGQSELRPPPAPCSARGDRASASARRPPCSASSPCWIASPRHFPAASGSASRSAARWCAIRSPSCSTSRCPISTPSCGPSMRTRAVKLHHTARPHHRPCHPRPGRGDDHGRAHLHHEGRPHRAGRRARSRSIAIPPTPSSPDSSPARR